MKFLLHSLAFLLFGPLAHASFTAQESVTLPAREGSSKKFLFVNSGTRVIEVGNRELSRIYDLKDLSTYLLLTGQSFDSPLSILQRRATQEIFYIGDIKENDWGSQLRRYLRGYSLSDSSVQTTYSNTLYKGASYNIPSFVISMNPDETRIYFAKLGANTVSVLNLDTYNIDATFGIPEVSTRKIQLVKELKYNSATVLAVDTKETNGLSTLLFFDPILAKNILTLKAEAFGLASGGPTYAVLRSTEFSKDGTQVLMCGKIKCVIYNLTTKTVTASWAMDGTAASDVKFSDDGRLVFIADGTLSNTTFSVIEAATGQTLLSPIKVRLASLLKIFSTADAQSYVVMLKDRLLHLSAHNGALLAEQTLPSATENFESLAYLDEDPQSIRFRTSKDTGEIHTWLLSR